MRAAIQHNAKARVQLQGMTRATKGVLAGAVMVTIYLYASAEDYKDALEREQHMANAACKAAGASHAVRVDADGSSIYICNQPIDGVQIERARARARAGGNA